MTKKLQALRDEAADKEYDKIVWGGAGTEEVAFLERDFKQGFNCAHDLLMTEAQALVEALKYIEEEPSRFCIGIKADEALARWQKWKGEK